MLAGNHPTWFWPAGIFGGSTLNGYWKFVYTAWPYPSHSHVLGTRMFFHAAMRAQGMDLVKLRREVVLGISL